MTRVQQCLDGRRRGWCSGWYITDSEQQAGDRSPVWKRNVLTAGARRLRYPENQLLEDRGGSLRPAWLARFGHGAMRSH